jgi:hypothetical protein
LGGRVASKPPSAKRTTAQGRALADLKSEECSTAVPGRLPPSLMISLYKINAALSAARYALARRPAARLRLILMIDSRCRGFGSVISENVSAMM